MWGVGQNRPACGFNPARLKKDENKIKNAHTLHVQEMFLKLKICLRTMERKIFFVIYK